MLINLKSVFGKLKAEPPKYFNEEFKYFLGEPCSVFREDNRDLYWAHNQEPTVAISPRFSNGRDAVIWLDRNTDKHSGMFTPKEGECQEIRNLALYQISRRPVMLVRNNGDFCFLTF